MNVMVPKNVKVQENRCLGNCCCCFVSSEENYAPAPPLEESIKLNLSIGWNASTFHRIIALSAFIYLWFSDNFRFDPTEFKNSAVKGGGILSSSSSFLPMYPLEYAILKDQFITNNGK